MLLLVVVLASRSGKVNADDSIGGKCALVVDALEFHLASETDPVRRVRKRQKTAENWTGDADNPGAYKSQYGIKIKDLCDEV